MKIDELKCKYCGNEMVLDGKDYTLTEGYYYAFWLCKKCGVMAIEKVRYGNRVTVDWVEFNCRKDKEY